MAMLPSVEELMFYSRKKCQLELHYSLFKTDMIMHNSKKKYLRLTKMIYLLIIKPQIVFMLIISMPVMMCCRASQLSILHNIKAFFILQIDT